MEFLQEILKLQSRQANTRPEKIHPMTKKEFNKRIDKSMEDSKKGKLTEVNDLMAEIEKWS